MRPVPLKREFQRLARERQEEAPRRELGPWLTLAAIYALAVLFTSPFLLYRPEVFVSGTAPAETVLARVPFEYELQASEDRWEEERERRYKRVYQYDSEAKAEALIRLQELSAAVSNLDPGAPPAELLAALSRQDHRLSFLPLEDVAGFVSTARDKRFQLAMQNALREAYDDCVIVENRLAYLGHYNDNVFIIDNRQSPLRKREALSRPLPYPFDWFEWRPIVGRRLFEQYGIEEIPPPLQRAATTVMSLAVQYNLKLDEGKSETQRKGYPRPDLATRFRPGDVLVAAGPGATVSPDQQKLLEKHYRAVARLHMRRFAGQTGFIAVLFALFAMFLRQRRDFRFRPDSLLVVGLPVLLGLGIQGFSVLIAEGDAAKVEYLFPAGAIGMMGVLLLDVRMALLLVTVGCMVFGLQADLDFHFVVVALVGGYTAVAGLQAIRTRRDVFLASLLVGVVNGVVIYALAFMQNPGEYPPLAGPAMGFFSGIFSFLVLAVLPVFERFGIITDMQLLELTGLNHPLLRQMEDRAPGTWQHTLNVSKLAEAAAQEIGVNYLLVRAGCLFHDIGKVKKPEYFTENQITREDRTRHDELAPIMSARVIRNHVKEGIEMAQRARLPERIVDFIREHHGTTLIAYFYHKALNQQQAGGAGKDSVREGDFRYTGPRPQSIETAIVMLADSTEATATARLSGRTVTEDDIQKLVRTTIFDKFNDGQFNECNLTLRDLDVIREVFVEVLRSRFHTRIDYPRQGAAPAPGKPAPAQQPAAVAPSGAGKK